jgi:hypothetical protein
MDNTDYILIDEIPDGDLIYFDVSDNDEEKELNELFEPTCELSPGEEEILPGWTLDDLYECTVDRRPPSRFTEQGFDKFTGEFEGGATISGPVEAARNYKLNIGDISDLL